MGKGESSLVPGWLKNTASVIGGVSSASRTLHSDVTSSNQKRNITSNGITISLFDDQRPKNLVKSSSTNSSWVSGSGNHCYTSFNRSLRDVNGEKEKERSGYTGHSDHDCEPLGNIISNRTEKETLRPSHSSASTKKSELFLPRKALDSKSNLDGNYSNNNAPNSANSAGSNIKTSVLDKDFPSLGIEENLAFPELRKVPNGGINMGSSDVQQIAAVSSGLGPAVAGLNMAEALALVPLRCHLHPEIDEETAKTQRLEELAIKQSRQLIPLTPVLTKALVPNSSDKLKPKVPTRTGRANTAAKNRHQLPPITQNTNHSFCSGQVKSDSPKSSDGRFHVLKPVRENGVSLTRKDAASSTIGSSSQLNFAPSDASTSLKSPNHSDHSSVKRKSAGLDLRSGLPTEKRLTQAQVKSRNDFFNLIKKKTSMSCSSTVLPSSDPIISSPSEVKSGEAPNEAASYPVSSDTVGDMEEVTNNEDANEEAQRPSSKESHANEEAQRSSSKEKPFFPNEVACPDEEEAAFLRSLGWEESSGEDEGLTEEEISAFYQEYMDVKPSLKVSSGVLLKNSMLSESHKAN